jgi:hypothetical protein
LDTFRTKAFNPALPALLPGQFCQLPAIKTWFSTDPKNHHTIINRDRLDRFGEVIVTLEITHNGQFARIEQPLSFFLE